MADERQLVIAAYILTLAEVRETELVSVHMKFCTFTPTFHLYYSILTHTCTHTHTYTHTHTHIHTHTNIHTYTHTHTHTHTRTHTLLVPELFIEY